MQNVHIHKEKRIAREEKTQEAILLYSNKNPKIHKIEKQTKICVYMVWMSPVKFYRWKICQPINANHIYIFDLEQNNKLKLPCKTLDASLNTPL